MHQDTCLDLYEMRRYVAVHSCKITISLEPELCDDRTLFPVILFEPNGPFYGQGSNKCSLQLVMAQPRPICLAPWL